MTEALMAIIGTAFVLYNLIDEPSLGNIVLGILGLSVILGILMLKLG